MHYLLLLGGSDYTGINTTVTISASQQNFSFNVTIIDNDVLELLEVGLEVIGTPYIDVGNNVNYA